MPHYSSFLADCSRLRQEAGNEGIKDFCMASAVHRNGELLIVRRCPEEEFAANHWEIPGGRLEAGEEFSDGLVRELKEETGLSMANIEAFVDTFDFPTDEGYVVREFNFLVSTESYDIVLDPKEHSAFAWISADDIEKYLMTKEMRATIEKAIGLMLKQ